MGVGVYENKFDGFGGTFIVASSYFDEDAYEKYISDLASNLDVEVFEKDGNFYYKTDGLISLSEFDNKISALERGIKHKGEFLMTYESWAEQSSQDEYHDVRDFIEESLKDIEFVSCIERDAWMDMEGRFNLICGNDYFEVGVMEWETDYVIGVAPTEKLNDILESEEEIRAEFSKNPDDFREQMRNLGEDIKTLARASLFENGFKARYKTSGYTSSTYEDLDMDSIQHTIEELKRKIRTSSEEIFKKESRIKMK